MKKSGMAHIQIIGLIVLSVAAFLLIAQFISAGGGDATSLTPRADGCVAKSISVVVDGNIIVRDQAGVGVTPVVTALEITSVKAGGKPLTKRFDSTLGIFSQSYTWSLTARDATTNNQIDSAQGEGKIYEFGDGQSASHEFLISFFVPDQDCNGVIDDFQAKLTGRTLDQNQDTASPYQARLSFTDGSWRLVPE